MARSASDIPAALGWDAAHCPVQAAIDVVEDRPTVLVLREVFSGVRRFDDIRVRTGMSRQVLAMRLTRMVDSGLLRRHAYQDPGERRRFEYRLTGKGFDLYPLLVALLDWGTRHAPGPDGPGTVARHRDCGALVHTRLECETGHGIARMRDVVLTPGPGAGHRGQDSPPGAPDGAGR